MAQGSLSSVQTNYLEIREYNFSWPGDNGTLQDVGTVNYTMPLGMLLAL